MLFSKEKEARQLDQLSTWIENYRWMKTTYVVILSKNFAHEFVFSMVNGFDNESVIPRVVEKTPAFTRGSQLGENVLVG
jgi:hypothetical protein